MNKHMFVREVAALLGCHPRRAAVISFVVLQELQNRLTPAEVRAVTAHLPAGLKRFWHEHDHPGRRVARPDRSEFLGRIRRWAALEDEAEAERAVRAVFAVLQTVLGSATGPNGEVFGVVGEPSKDLKLLWRAAAAAPPSAAVGAHATT